MYKGARKSINVSRRLFSYLLLFVLAIAVLAGCNNENAESPAGGDASSGEYSDNSKAEGEDSQGNSEVSQTDDNAGLVYNGFSAEVERLDEKIFEGGTFYRGYIRAINGSTYEIEQLNGGPVLGTPVLIIDLINLDHETRFTDDPAEALIEDYVEVIYKGDKAVGFVNFGSLYANVKFLTVNEINADAQYQLSCNEGGYMIAIADDTTIYPITYGPNTGATLSLDAASEGASIMVVLKEGKEHSNEVVYATAHEIWLLQE